MKIEQRIDWLHFLTHGGLIYLVLALVCIIGAGLTLSDSAGQHAWRKTEGIITLSRVEPPMPGSQKRTRHLFAYEYRVDGKTYRSDRYSFASLGGNPSAGVRRYKKGDRVSVYYNPQNPATAVLLKEQPGLSVYVVLGFGLLFLLAAVSSLLTRSAFTVFSASGWIQLWEQLTNRRQQAIERLSQANAHAGASPETLVDALHDPLLRECLHYLTDAQQIYPPDEDSQGFRLENAARHLHAATGISLETTRKMMQRLAQRQGLSSDHP